MKELFLVLYLALPAFVANMTPVVAAKLNLLPSLARSVDGGRKLRDKEVLGTHKTWRGFVVGITAAMLISLLQFLLIKIQLFNLIPFLEIGSALGYGILAGTGALVGDAVASFAKRQLGIGSGKPFIPFDQIDYILGFLFFTSLVYPWELNQIITLLVFAVIANPLTNIFAYFLGIKKTYW